MTPLRLDMLVVCLLEMQAVASKFKASAGGSVDGLIIVEMRRAARDLGQVVG